MPTDTLPRPRPGGKSSVELFGPGEVPNTTRDRLIWTSMDLFYSHGFHAVGLDRILAEVGVTKTTFYNHFESKDTLIEEVLRVRDHWESRAMMHRLEVLTGGEPARMLLGMFDVLNEWFNSPEFLGCAFLNAATEYPSAHDPIHQVAAQHSLNLVDRLEEWADAAGADDPRAVAEGLSILIDGALAMRHVQGRDDAAAVAREMALRLLRERLPGFAGLA